MEKAEPHDSAFKGGEKGSSKASEQDPSRKKRAREVPNRKTKTNFLDSVT